MNLSKPHSIIYLHGLGSSPHSQKGQLLRERAHARGIEFISPDLNIPSPTSLSPTVIVETVVGIVTQSAKSSDSSITIWGSSFGGFIALQILRSVESSVLDSISRCVLLAPAIFPWHPKDGLISPEIEREWRRTGVREIYHYALEQRVLLPIQFVDELRSMPTFEGWKPLCDTMIIHGTRDSVIPHKHSEEFIAERPAITLFSVNEEHDLLEQPNEWLSVALP